MSAPARQSDADRARDARIEELCAEVPSAALLDPAVVPQIAAVLEAPDFGRRASVWVAIRNLVEAAKPLTLPDLAAELERMGELERIGGRAALAEIADAAPTAVHAVAHARELRRLVLEDRLARAYRRRARDLDDELAAAEVRRLEAELETGQRGGPGLDSLAFAGARLLELLERPRPEPVEVGRPAQGHLWLVVAPSMVGKTTLALWAAMARAAGASPWPGAAARPAGRVLLLSLDEAPEQVARRMHGLATFHPAGRLERYAHRLAVIGPDRDIEPGKLDSLRFDDAGLELLTRWLSKAEADGAPFVEVYLDAYADLLPLGEAENSNETATRIGGALERLAVRFGCAVTLLHHAGKPKPDASEDPDVRFLGRGASALAAKARVVSALEAVPGLPHLRRIRTLTNLGPAPRSMLFEVGDPAAPTEELLYWRPAPDALDIQPGEIIQPGERISTRDLARRLAGDALAEGAAPPGEVMRRAAALRERWRETGRVHVHPGPRNALMLELAEATEEAP